MTQMLLTQISIGERRREDLGDVAGLAASITRYGLLHPIVVDPAGRLVAGERRLRACESLGWEWVDVRQLDELTDDERRAIELEENLRRKDLTPAERSRTMVRLAETAREASHDFRSTTERKSDIGRPQESGSYRDVEQRTGIPAPTLKRAEQHVAAVLAYPELEPLPQSEAIRTAKALDALPAETRDQARERAKVEQASADRILDVVAEIVPGARERMERAALKTEVHKGQLATRRHLLSLDATAAASVIEPDDYSIAHWFIRDCRTWLEKFERGLTTNIRLVESQEAS